MYRYQCTYTNSRNEVIELGPGSSVHLDENDLFDYERDYVTAQGRLVAISGDVVEKSIKMLYLQQDEETAKRYLAIMDYDLRSLSPGTLTVNGYSRRGVFFAASTEDYMWRRGLMMRDTRFLALDSDWSRRHVLTFEPSAGASGQQLTYPRGYPHDYGAAPAPKTFTNPSAFPSDFLLRIYGPCTDPYIVIGGNVYSVSCTVQDGGFLVIDSKDKSAIYNYDAGGVAQNVFDAAALGAEGGGSYVFERIAPGVNQLSWPNTFRFDLELLDSVSVPPIWEEEE